MLSRESFVMRTSVVRAAFSTREEYNTPVGRGMYHSEINNRKDIPMRFTRYGTCPNSSTDTLRRTTRGRSIREN